MADHYISEGMESSQPTEEQLLLQKAQLASSSLKLLSVKNRDNAIQHLISAFRTHIDDVLEANTLDLETSRDLALPTVLINWLKLTPDRLQKATLVLEQLLEPLNFPVSGTFQSGISKLVHQGPIGVVGLVYETLPELAIILAGMCLKTGNALVLRGGTETSHTNEAIAHIIQVALQKADFPGDSIVLLPSNRRISIESLVKQSSGLDLVIPYGRPSLVQQVSRLSEIPILQTAIGNCYLFWSPTGSVEQVETIVTSSHCGHPEAVNSVDKVVVPANLQRPLLTLLWDNLEEAGFEIMGDQELCSEFPDIAPADPSIWSQPSLRKLVVFKLVQNLQEGTKWINTYSSGHADCIVSDSSKEIQVFMSSVDSATIFINRTPEFSRLRNQIHSSVAFGMAKRGGASQGVIDLYSLLKTREIYQGLV